NCMAVRGLWSTSSLPTLARPSYSAASSSMIGAIIRHGPHQTAQKSTSTGTSDCSTSCSKLSSVSVTYLTFSPMMIAILLFRQKVRGVQQVWSGVVSALHGGHARRDCRLVGRHQLRALQVQDRPTVHLQLQALGVGDRPDPPRLHR